MAVEAAENGAKLVLTARSEKTLQEVKEKCLKEGNVREEDILVMPMDMCDFNKHEEAFKAVLKHFGKVWIILNLNFIYLLTSRSN